MKFGLEPEILENIISQIKKRKEIMQAVIFGSRARGDYHYNSDIDIAVYCEGELPVSLYSDIDESSGIYKINLINMNSMKNVELKNNVEKDGKEIYVAEWAKKK